VIPLVALTDSQRDRMLHDPSLLIIAAAVAIGLGIRALWRRWYDQHISPEKAAALANEEAALRNYRRFRRGASTRQPNTDLTWERSWRDEEQWRRTDDQP
jgi:hypothetical protein